MNSISPPNKRLSSLSLDTHLAAKTIDHSSPISSPTDLTTLDSLLSDDVDLSLVYALHTFAATMDGQVAVVRSEPLILLDDSNSYWWLVKPLRSNTIGYIPAEIIETPYERLARVNQQKNIQSAVFRSDDIPGAPSKSTRPSLTPKTVVFPSDPRGEVFEYSPAFTDESSGDEDETLDSDGSDQASSGKGNDPVSEEDRDTQPQKLSDSKKAATVVGESSAHSNSLDMSVRPSPRRTSLGAGLLLRKHDSWRNSYMSDDTLLSDYGSLPLDPTDSKPTKTSVHLSSAFDADEEIKTVQKPRVDSILQVKGRSSSPPTEQSPISDIDPITVLRIFPGVCSIPADSQTFKTVVITKTMSVTELLHQALLKYRVFGPLASAESPLNRQEPGEIISDWYLTLTFTDTVNSGQHYTLDPLDNVLKSLTTLQKLDEDRSSINTSSPPVPPKSHHLDSSSNDTSSPVSAKSPRKGNILSRFASKLYTPTLLANTNPSQHYLPKPIFHIISPQDSSSIRLMLQQYSVVNSKAQRSNQPKETPLPSSDIHRSSSSSSNSTLIRVELLNDTDQSNSTNPNMLGPVRMAKTLKINRDSPAFAVVGAALRKFSIAEGHTLGQVLEYELTDADTGCVVPMHSPLSLTSNQLPTFTLRRLSPYNLDTNSVNDDAFGCNNQPTVKSLPLVPDMHRSDSAAIITHVESKISRKSTNSPSRFSDLLSEAQSLDISSFLEEGPAHSLTRAASH